VRGAKSNPQPILLKKKRKTKNRVFEKATTGKFGIIWVTETGVSKP